MENEMIFIPPIHFKMNDPVFNTPSAPDLKISGVRAAIIIYKPV